jgi:glycogen debranching enzyme
VDDIIQIEDRFYILASSSRADERTRVLKHGETFAVFDHLGDVVPLGLGEQGVYHEGTHFLSSLELRLGGQRPLLLSSTVKDSNDLLTVDLTNPDIALGPSAGGPVLRHGMLHIQRSKFLWDATCHERLQVTHHGLEPVGLTLSLRFDADFADIFEVRGTRREARGRREESRLGPGEVVLGYRGLDGIVRHARLTADPAPAVREAGRLEYQLELVPQHPVALHVAVACERAQVQVAGGRPLAITASPEVLRPEPSATAGAAMSRASRAHHDLAWEAA